MILATCLWYVAGALCCPHSIGAVLVQASLSLLTGQTMRRNVSAESKAVVEILSRSRPASRSQVLMMAACWCPFCCLSKNVGIGRSVDLPTMRANDFRIVVRHSA